MTPIWFDPCPQCKDPDECERVLECAEGFDCERATGFDFTQEDEDRHNDPRRR